MARGKKSGGRPFAKGTSGNAKGRPPLPEDVRAARALTATEAVRLLNRVVYLTDAEFNAELADPTKTKLERMLMSVVARAESGDYTALAFLFERLIGKVKEPPQEHVLNFAHMPRPQVIELAQQAIKKLEEVKG